VQKGRLRFVVTQNSHDALRWQPGSLRKRHQAGKTEGGRSGGETMGMEV
jgi:hypothetical protein